MHDAQGAPGKHLAPERFRKVTTSCKCNPSNQSHLSAENQGVPLRALSCLFSCWMKYLSISCNHSTTQVVLLCFLLPRFFFFNWNEERVKLGVFLCNSFMSICGMLLLSPLLVPSFPSLPPPHICLPPVIPCLSAYLFIELFVYYAPPYLPAVAVCAE